MLKLFEIALLGILACGICFLAKAYAAEPKTEAPKPQTIVLAGGCFWGVEAVFEHTKGVKKAVSGYTGGQSATAHYETVSKGNTGHAEAVQVTYNPAQISIGQLLDIYFKVAHNPTQLNYQGPDHGTQYRSSIFYATPAQRKAAEAKIANLTSLHLFFTPIVTRLEPLHAFYPAEAYHQNFAALHPTNPYIIFYDAPKVAQLKKSYPHLYKESLNEHH